MLFLLTLGITSAPVFSNSGDITTFPVGPGFVDVIPRQLVRANNDRLYVFAGRQENTTAISAYWTTTPGLPTASTDFSGQATLQDTAAPISVEAVYDGAETIHVLVNNNNGILNDYPFSTATDSFLAPITIASGNPTVSGDYIGTSGVSGMVDMSGGLHVVYWSAGNHITHKLLSYDPVANTLTQLGEDTQVDTNGLANHPSVAVSPLDNSLTVAWVSESVGLPGIVARTRSADGRWDAPQLISTSPVWTSTTAGINIDQGPSLLITSTGVKYLTYIENWDRSGFYGHIHLVTNFGAGWVDTAVPHYSHDPAPAINSDGDVYIIGHGAESDGTNINMYVMKQSVGDTWEPLQLVAAPPAGSSFDSGPSVKWSAVGYNRPDTIEFLYFWQTTAATTTVYYGRVDPFVPTPTATETPTASETPAESETGTPSVDITATASDVPTSTLAADETPVDTPAGSETSAPSGAPTNTPTSTATISPTTTGTLTSTPTLTLTHTPDNTLTPSLITYVGQVLTGNDDVNQSGPDFEQFSPSVWLGNTSSVPNNYTAFRFTNVQVPRGVTITSAHVELYSIDFNQWLPVNVQIAGDAADNSLPFTASTPPSQRALTAARALHNSTYSWIANNWYQLSDMRVVVQEITTRPNWQPGNAMSIIAIGTGISRGRIFVSSFERGAAFAPRLVITYTS
ncbi:MAG: hypothetical protein R3E39_31740 [Anaerolineae bacterium]